MTFKMDCPHCKRTLNVTEKAFGKTVPCPGCNQPVTVPEQARSLAPPVHEVGTAPPPLRDGMPSIPEPNIEAELEASSWGFPKGVPCSTGAQKAVPTSGKPKLQASSNTQVASAELPARIRDVLPKGDDILYASRPARSALALSMILHGIVWSLVGLAFFLIGIVVTLPLALVITYLSWRNRYYIITNKRTIVSQGITNVAIKVVFNRHIQLISINTGIIDRWLGLNSIELSTAAQGGVGGIMANFRGLSKGSVQLKYVNVKDIAACYEQLQG